MEKLRDRRSMGISCMLFILAGFRMIEFLKISKATAVPAEEGGVT
jgi:hypothetical protein